MEKSEILRIGNELVGIVKGEFPLHAEFDSTFDGVRGSYVCRVNWLLYNDERRPNKPARIILIIISREAIADSKYDEHPESIQSRFKAFIQNKLNSFNPEHDEPHGKAPPVAEWVVENLDLNP